MNNKITILEIAAVLTRKHGLEQPDAERFATVMFDVVKEGLSSDSQVKVKGLGTFKVVGVEARESVNINSGERFMIDSHEKITFTPDADMREMVNKPFSQFETVELREELNDEDLVTAYQAEEEPATKHEEPMAELDKPTKPKEEPMDGQAIGQEAVVAPVAEPETPVAEPEPPVEEPEMPAVEPEMQVAPEPTEEEPDGRHSLGWLLWTVALIAVGAVAYYSGYRHGQHQQAASLAVVSTDTTEHHVDTTVQKTDTTVQKTDTTVEKTDTAALTTATDTTAPATAAPAGTTAADTLADYKKYERMDARVRTGAYIIIGTDRVVSARSGDNLARVSRRELGEGMVCYVAVYNGMTDEQTLQAGQQIKIPKLKWKKKARK